MVFVWLVRAQMLCAVGILVWMAFGLGAATRDGFEPERERYRTLPPDTRGAVDRILARLPATDGRVLILGEADVAELIEGLQEKGVEVRHRAGEPWIEAAEGVDIVCLVEDRVDFRHLDYAHLASVMRAKLILDFTTFADESAADAAGFEVIVMGPPQWPAWLDPEYLRFVAHVREQVPEQAAILLVPSRPYRSTLPRTRWFLHLNYALSPRRLYLWRPELASGYVMQYFSWVEAINALAPWTESTYVRIKDRALTKLKQSESAPTRSLSSEELEAARQIGAEWVLLYTPNADFLLVDWEILPLERVRAWSEKGS